MPRCTYFILDNLFLVFRASTGSGRAGSLPSLPGALQVLRPDQLRVQPGHLLLQTLNPPVLHVQNARQRGRILIEFLLYFGLKSPVLFNVVVQFLQGHATRSQSHMNQPCFIIYP